MKWSHDARFATASRRINQWLLVGLRRGGQELVPACSICICDPPRKRSARGPSEFADGPAAARRAAAEATVHPSPRVENGMMAAARDSTDHQLWRGWLDGWWLLVPVHMALPAWPGVIKDCRLWQAAGRCLRSVYWPVREGKRSLVGASCSCCCFGTKPPVVSQGEQFRNTSG